MQLNLDLVIKVHKINETFINRIENDESLATEEDIYYVLYNSKSSKKNSNLSINKNDLTSHDELKLSMGKKDLNLKTTLGKEIDNKSVNNESLNREVKCENSFQSQQASCIFSEHLSTIPLILDTNSCFKCKNVFPIGQLLKCGLKSEEYSCLECLDYSTNLIQYSTHKDDAQETINTDVNSGVILLNCPDCGCQYEVRKNANRCLNCNSIFSESVPSSDNNIQGAQSNIDSQRSNINEEISRNDKEPDWLRLRLLFSSRLNSPQNVDIDRSNENIDTQNIFQGTIINIDPQRSNINQEIIRLGNIDLQHDDRYRSETEPDWLRLGLLFSSRLDSPQNVDIDRSSENIDTPFRIRSRNVNRDNQNKVKKRKKCLECLSENKHYLTVDNKCLYCIPEKMNTRCRKCNIDLHVIHDRFKYFRFGSEVECAKCFIELNNLIKNIEILDKCSICIEVINGDHTKATIQNCGHMFHQECISEALETKPACPNCRQNYQRFFIENYDGNYKRKRKCFICECELNILVHKVTWGDCNTEHLFCFDCVGFAFEEKIGKLTIYPENIKLESLQNSFRFVCLLCRTPLSGLKW